MSTTKHASPGLSEKIIVVLDAQVGEKVVELIEEQLLRPKGGVAILCNISVTTYVL